MCFCSSLYLFHLTSIFLALTKRQLNVPSCLTLLPGQLQMLKEVVDKERSRRRTRTPNRAPPSPLSVPLVGEIPAWVQTVRRLIYVTLALASSSPHRFRLCACAMQMFPPSVADRGWSPVGETPRLWKHVAPSRTRRLLTGCDHPTGSQRVNTCAAQWPSAQTDTTTTHQQTIQCVCVSLQVGVQALPRDPERPRRLHYWRRKSSRCIERYSAFVHNGMYSLCVVLCHGCANEAACFKVSLQMHTVFSDWDLIIIHLSFTSSSSSTSSVFFSSC